MIAEAPEGFVDYLAQVMLPMIGVVLFSAVYALQLVANKLKLLAHPLILEIGILVVLVTSFGTERGVRFNLVGIRVDQLNFIREEFLSEGGDEFNQVVVILPEERICKFEPCNPLMGFQPHEPEWHLTRPNGYRFTLSMIGIDSGSTEFTFVTRGKTDAYPVAVLIDWNKYVRARLPEK